MDVIIDGAAGFEVEGNPETVMGVVNAALDYLHNSGRAMVRVSVDGDDLDPESLAARYADAPVSDAMCIEIASRPVAELADETLRELEQSLPELPSACRQLAEIFQSDAPEEGFEPFHQLAHIWGLIKAKQQALANILDLDLHAVEFDGRPLPKHSDELNGFLHEAAQALQDGDTVLLGDLLEYELAPRAEFESRIVDTLRQAVRTA